jgi:hypothetical protein
MTRHTTLPDKGDRNFDLSAIFIAREQQLDLFDLYLTRWKRILFDADPDLETPVLAASSPANKLQGLIVLLYGRGGFGKSTLLGRYRVMAQEEDRHLRVSTIVDWEFAVEGKRGLFNPPAGQEVDAAEYYRVLYAQLAMALEKDARSFREYQAAIKAVDEARKRASGVLESMQNDDRYATFRTVTMEGLLALARSFVPGSGVLLDNPIVKAAADAGAKITVEQLSQMHARLRATLGNKLSDYLDPALRLGLALGRDLAELARNLPLLVCFDTYEEVDEADHLLRIVMGTAGARVGWVLAGRDNLWAGSEQRRRSIGKVYGYKEIVLPTLGLAIDFNAGGVGAFTTSDITAYFALLHERVSA